MIFKYIHHNNLQAVDSMRFAEKKSAKHFMNFSACLWIWKVVQMLLFVCLKIDKKVKKKTNFFSFLKHFPNLFHYRFCNTLKRPQEKHLARYLESF